MQVTWKQFKDEVDRQLAEQGRSENVEIEYIDVSWLDSITEIECHVSSAEMLAI